MELHQLRLLHPLPPLATGRCKSGDRWSSVAARCAVSFSSICSIELAYTLWSPYTIYYAFSMFGQILLCLSAVYQIFQKGVQLGSMFHFIFYGSNLAAALILARNAYNWPSLIKSIEEIENQLPYFRRNFRTIITLTTALMLANCAVEHILFVAHGLIIAYSCDPDNVIDIYLKLYKSSIYEFTRGSAWRWVVTEIFTLQGSFNYSYNDFIMVLVSLYLSEYFLVHNKRLKKAVQQSGDTHTYASEYRRREKLNTKRDEPEDHTPSQRLNTAMFCVHIYYVTPHSLPKLGALATCKCKKEQNGSKKNFQNEF
ncbi:unnamed protein product [Arctia plantaginis]|uniref:Uncharacterized protein n=1 Tax=Arctia plantaginis TaxID=874455 RepID=A0A8S1AHG3_ARCPL|nr:unnamed protein product [Arctia plantaginis]